MSLAKIPEQAKLIIGLFLKEKEEIALVAAELIERFGPVDTISPWLPFDFTDYYEKEMGKPLFRRMFSFKSLREQSEFPEIKIQTNAVETKYSKNGKRTVNIDPGYLLQSRFVLVTGKDFAHRIYVGSGIYADLTLIYRQKSFQKLPWTYPDYATENMCFYLKQVRNKYLMDLKRLSSSK